MPCWQPRQGPGTVPEALDETSQPKHGLCHQVPSRSPPLLSHLIAMATSAQLVTFSSFTRPRNGGRL